MNRPPALTDLRDLRLHVVPACLPIPPSLRGETLLLADDGLTVLASPNATEAPCPPSGERADRVHSRFTRTIADLPWADAAVRFRLRVRKFFCRLGDGGTGATARRGAGCFVIDSD